MKTLDELFNEITTSESDALKEEFLAALKDKEEGLQTFLKKYDCQATVEEFQAFLQEKAEENKEVGDEELGAVSGGNWWSFAAASVASFLIGCAAHAFVSAGKEAYDSSQGKKVGDVGDIISCSN